MRAPLLGSRCPPYRHPSEGWGLRRSEDNVGHIAPTWITLFNKPDFPFPLPGFKRLLAGDGERDVIMWLDQNQSGQAVFLAKGRTSAVSMLFGARSDVGSDTDIDNPPWLVGQDVGEAAASRQFSTVARRCLRPQPSLG